MHTNIHSIITSAINSPIPVLLAVTQYVAQCQHDKTQLKTSPAMVQQMLLQLNYTYDGRRPVTARGTLATISDRDIFTMFTWKQTICYPSMQIFIKTHVHMETNNLLP